MPEFVQIIILVVVLISMFIVILKIISIYKFTEAIKKFVKDKQQELLFNGLI